MMDDLEQKPLELLVRRTSLIKYATAYDHVIHAHTFHYVPYILCNIYTNTCTALIKMNNRFGFKILFSVLTLLGDLPVTFCDSTLNTANLCPAISVVGLFYLFTVMFTSVVDIESYGVDFTRRFRFCMCA